MMRHLSHIALATALLGAADKAQGQYEIEWFNVTNSGTVRMAGGAFEMVATAGQPGAGPVDGPMTGDDFSAGGGF